MSRLDTLVLSSNQLTDINPMMEDMVNLRSDRLSVGLIVILSNVRFVFTQAGLSISGTIL